MFRGQTDDDEQPEPEVEAEEDGGPFKCGELNFSFRQSFSSFFRQEKWRKVLLGGLLGVVFHKNYSQKKI